MRTTGQKREANGFTLVELLVVLGIISVLVALLLPALVGMRKKAQAVVCAANLRSVGQALSQYVQQYNHYPCCYLWDNGHFYAIWPVRLRPFTGGEQGVFYCPSQDERCEWKKVAPEAGALGRATEVHARFGYEIGEPLLDGATTPFSYGYNAWGGHEGGEPTPKERHKGLGDMLHANPRPGDFVPRELHARRVRKPAETIAITEGNGDGSGDFGSKPNPHWERDRPAAVHSGGLNVLFCDGHVQWYPRKVVLIDMHENVPSEAYIRRMWNNDHRVNGGDTYQHWDPG
jgi:prepilin-type processing-associated H-X9-DG protein/prepilin-type N-terminal cleavage/methylation domain-containing protein